MISFIVEGFDPWKHVYALLEQIVIVGQKIQEEYEVILLSSFLLDISYDECVKIGTALFGKRFYIVCDDSLSLFDARCVAQERAHGNIFCYLSPQIKLENDCLEQILEVLKKEPELDCVCPCLSFKFYSDSEPRVLSFGYGETPEGSISPLILGAFLNAINFQHIRVSIFHPYCFCSRKPFYLPEDDGKTSFERHVAACLRNRNAGMNAAALRAEVNLRHRYFALYLRLLSQIKIDYRKNSLDFLALANSLEIDVILTPYFDFLMTEQSYHKAPWQVALDAGDADSIFWALLLWRRPELIAGASRVHVPSEPLMELVTFCLWKAATFLHADCCQHARYMESFFSEDPLITSLYRSWIDSYAGDVLLFPHEDISVWTAFWKTRHKFLAIKNICVTVLSGIFSYKC